MTEGVIEDHSSKFSPSKLSTYRECPQRYKFRYIDGLRRLGQTVEQFLGTCVHKAFETLHEGLQKGRCLAEEQALEVFEAEYGLGFAAVLPGPDGAPNREEWRNVGRACVSNYYRQWRPFDKDRTVAVEKRIGFPIELDGKAYRLEGFIDRLAISTADEAFEIHDYKTAKTLPPQRHADDDWQLALYEIAVRHEWPDTKEVRLVWHYVRHGKSLVSRRTSEQLAALKAEAAALIARIKSDHEFSPRESALCGWCEFRSHCPVFAHAESLSKLPLELRSCDEGRQAVDALEAVDQRKRALRAQIKALEIEQGFLEAQVIRFAQRGGFKSVSGSRCDAAISTRVEWKFPTKTHSPERLAELEKELKRTPLWEYSAHFDSHRFLGALKEKPWPHDWAEAAESVLSRYAQRAAEPALRLRRRRDADE